MIAIHTALREKGEILQAFLIPKAGIPRGGGGGRVKNKKNKECLHFTMEATG